MIIESWVRVGPQSADMFTRAILARHDRSLFDIQDSVRAELKTDLDKHERRIARLEVDRRRK